MDRVSQRLLISTKPCDFDPKLCLLCFGINFVNVLIKTMRVGAVDCTKCCVFNDLAHTHLCWFQNKSI